MALLLRKLENKNRWNDAPSVGEAVADVLRDFHTTEGKLSIYRMEDGNANLERVAAAICATRDNISYFDYALIPEEEITAVAPLNNESGKTPDDEANSSHQDVTSLNVSKVMAIAGGVLPVDRRRRILQKEVERLLRNSLAKGWLDRERVNPKLLIKLAA